MPDGVHVFVGTKAQYMKIAPLVWLMDDRKVAYRLIDTGQHAAFASALRPSLGIREPDVSLGGVRDVSTLPQSMTWAARVTRRLSSRRLRDEVFGGDGGVCLVHGDTLSTLLGAVMARRAGLAVAHVEAGLRSGSFLNPFPEEAIRAYVPRISALLFPPDPTATANLAAMGVKGRIVQTSGNTIGEALQRSLGDDPPPMGSGPVLMQLHRQENLRSRVRMDGFVSLACDIAAEHPVHFVLHGATRVALDRRGLLQRLEAAGVTVSGLLPRYDDFVRLLHSARFVIADGASLQEECAAIGVPTLLWRLRTERPDGLGRNVVLSRFDPDVTARFLAAPDDYRCPPKPLDSRPSEEILDAVVTALET